MPFTSETAGKINRMRGGRESCRRDKALGWPRLRKARVAALQLRRWQKVMRLIQELVEYSNGEFIVVDRRTGLMVRPEQLVSPARSDK